MSSVGDRDDRVMTLMAVAMTVAPEERSSYLRTVCGDDEELFRDIRDTIEWEERMDGFLLKPWMSLQELERPFQPGQVVNLRFEIIREIGQGGMGVVYEAFDRKRGQRIAIKSAKLGFRRLLSPELESALKVRHPNVCLVNEIHTAPTDHGDVDFLTMEFLEGLTLQTRLSSAGRLSSDEALEIVRQLCAGLAEAHRIGILHRDLKPANVILSKFPDGSLRAVITDFGLAGQPALGSGDLAGTPHYMAPELWRGATASKESDLYALGVIAYEMVTGEMPYRDEPTQVRLTRRPPAPSSRTGGPDRRGDAAIVRCLDPSPASRPHDAAELLASLTARPIRKLPLLVAMTVLLILAVVAGRDTIRAWLVPPLPSVRLAMLPVSADAVGEIALIDVAERLSQRTGPPTLVVIPASRSRDNNVRTPEQARRVFDATHALQITWGREGNTLLVHTEVVELSTLTRLEDISGRYSGAGDLSVAMTGAVSKALHLKDVPAERPSAAASAQYYQGLFYLRRDQHSFGEAIPPFRKAASLDPRSPLPLAGLAEALVLKYQEEKDPRLLDEADGLLQEARAFNPDSVPVLLAAGRLELVRGGHYEQALQNYRRVTELQPHNVEVWLRIAQAYDRQGLRKEVIESYRKAIALDPGNFEVYQEFGYFFWDRAEYANAVEQFHKAVAHAPGFSEAYTNLGATLSDMGEDAAAEEALRASLKIKESARALNSLGAIRAYQRRDAEALELYKRALALAPQNYIYLINLGDSSRREHLDQDARASYQRGFQLASTELQNDPQNARTRAFFAYFAARLGDRRRGEQEIEQALQFAPKNKSVLRRAVILYEMLGRRDRALQIAELATPDLVLELDRHPDLADFRQDPRFRELKAKSESEVDRNGTP